MDHFGIGAVMKNMVRMYSQVARRTGRTTSLVESVKNGDRIVFDSAAEAERVRHLVRERGATVECIVIPVDDVRRLFERPPSEGRTIFDHTWIEQFYQREIDKCAAHIDTFERESSGYGAAHRETKRRYAGTGDIR
jgi:hypothetical protein